MLGDARSFDSLNTPGAYIHVPNAELTAALMIHFTQKPAHSDLIGICEQWHVRPPKKMAPSVGIGDQHGKLNEVRLSLIRVAGAW
jgi:hypothetical protein